MLVNLIVQDVAEIIGHCISSYSWHSRKCYFFFRGSSWGVICLFLALSSVRPLSHFHLLIKYWAITDTFPPTVAHRIVWMRQQLLYIFSPQTKLHLWFWSHIPKEKSYLNISEMQWPHILTFLLALGDSSVVLPALEWSFNSESHVPTFFEYFLISFRLQNQET